MNDRPGFLIARLIRQAMPYRGFIALMLGLSLVTTALVGYQGYLLKELLDAMKRVENAGGDAVVLAAGLAELELVAWWMLALALPTGLAAYGGLATGQYLANRCMRDFRRDFVSHLTRLDLGFHQDLSRGELLSRVTADLDRMYSAQALLFGKLSQKPALSLGYVVAIAFTSWQLGLVVLVLLLPIGFIISRVLRRTRQRSLKAQQTQAGTLSAFEQITAGIRVIKSMGSGEREAERYAALTQDLFSDRQRVARAKAQSEGITQGSVLLIGGLALLAAGLLFTHRLITPTQLVPIVVYLGLMIAGLRELQRVWGDLQEHLPSAGRVFELLDRVPALADAPDASEAPVPRSALRLDRVAFRYQPGAEAVLAGIDLTIPVGRVTALVGPSGGGKSTLLDLLPRLRDVTSGAITWDGVDVRTRTMESLVRQVAIVNQDSFLFNDTVRNNIRYGRPGATEAEVIQAATRAHVHEAILALEGGLGYDTVVGDRGGRLSGGQRQRIAIARALLRDAPILLLDEPTSALDAESERHVQAALDELMRGRTVVVIAHRLATVQHAHAIHVIGKPPGGGPSRILESGTHETLVAQGGVYAGLVRLQTLG